MQWWCVLWLQASRDAGMWNAGWNEVIWPNACFHLRPEETVSLALPFPTPSYLSLSFPLALSLSRSLFHTSTHTHTPKQTHIRAQTHIHTQTHTQAIILAISPLRWKEELTSGTSLESDKGLKRRVTYTRAIHFIDSVFSSHSALCFLWMSQPAWQSL